MDFDPDAYLAQGPSGASAPFDPDEYLRQRSAPPGVVTRGSWYSQAPGWVDTQDRPGSNALGVPDSEQGIALPSRHTLGQWFDVTDPDGRTHRLQQTDIGPAKWTGRGVDISAAAASKKMGYTPKTFPTDKPFSVAAASGPPDSVAFNPDEYLRTMGQPAPVAAQPFDPDAYLAAKPAPQAAPAEAAGKPEDHWAFTRGIVQGVGEENLDSFAGFLRNQSYNAPEAIAGTLRGAADSIKGFAKGLTPEEYKRQAPGFFDTKDWSEAATWLGEATGAAVGSSIPPAVTGGVGAIAGGLAAGPPGAIVGGLGGAGLASLAQNQGDLFNELEKEGLPPETAAKYANVAGPMIAALDVGGLGTVVSRFTGIGEAKKEVAKHVAVRLAKEFAIGSSAESLTEATQQAIQEATVSLATGKDFLTTKTAKSIAEAGIVGGVVGGAMAAPAGLRTPQVEAKVPTAEESTAALAPPPAAPVEPPVPPTLEPPPVSTPEGDRLPQPVTPEAAFDVTPAGEGVIRTPDGGEIRFSQAVDPEPVFYSKLFRVAQDKLPNEAPGKQMENTLRNNGVKVEEINDTGLDALLARPKVSKVDIIEHLEVNGIQVEETFRTAKGETLYNDHIAPGANAGYTELTLRVPPKPGTLAYQDPHWQGEQNTVAHVQFTTRFDKAGEPMLHIEGIQGTGHQEGSKVGYLTKDEEAQIVELSRQRDVVGGEASRLAKEYYAAQQRLVAANRALTVGMGSVNQRVLMQQWENEGAITGNLQAQVRAAGQKAIQLTRQINAIRTSVSGDLTARSRPPGSLPFKSNWVELAVKRMVRHAADNGFAKISWNNGNLAAGWNTGAKGDMSQVSPQTIGGLNYFYDKVLPSRMKDAVKRFGGVLGATDIVVGPGIGGNGQVETMRVFHVTVPPAARTDIQRAVPMYAVRQGGPAAVINPNSNIPNAVRPHFVAATKRMTDAFMDYAKKFGFDNKVTVNVIVGPITVPGFGTYANVDGLAHKLPNGTYNIYMRADNFQENIAEYFATLMHEFGHVVVWENFAALPDATKLLMKEEYKQYRDTMLRIKDQPASVDAMRMMKEAAPRTWGRLMSGVGANLQKISGLTAQDLNYYLGDIAQDETGFHEWMADQVSRWATSTAEPISIVEKAYSGIAKALKLFMEYMARKFNIDARPSVLLTNWLNSFVSSARAMTPQEYAALDIRTQKLNQYYLQEDSGDPNVTGARMSAAAATTMSHVNQATGGSPGPAANAAAAHASKINWLYEWAGSILDLVQRNPQFTPLIRYVERVRNKDREEKEIHDAAMRVAKSWRGLGKKQEEALAEFLDELTNMTYLTPQERTRGITRHPTPQEVRALAARVGVEPRGLDIAVRVRNFTEKLLDLTSDMARVEANKIADPNVRIAKLTEINAMVAGLKARPYFPFMRFGRHFVMVKNPNGVTISFHMFERRGLVSAERQQQKKYEELRANSPPGDVVTMGLLPKTAEPFVGLPSVLLQHIRDKLNLTPLQLDALEQLQFDLSPARSFKHHFQHKRYVPGYSRDFLRAFSRYAFFGARYYAKVKYADDLRQDIRDAVKVGGNTAVRIADFMQDHLDNTILDSKGDYGTLKGLMFLWAMGYSPASATLNMTQTPMVTFPFLAAQFGGAKASRVMLQTMHKLSNFYKKGTYETQQEWELRAFGYGIKTGRIVETQSAELSALGQAGLLNLGSNTVVQRGANQVMEKSALFFELAEQWNRRIAYRATMRLAYENPKAKIVQEAISRYPSEMVELTQKFGFTAEQAQAIVTAGHITDRTQFVYASWARPRFMRGKLPGSIFIFKRYLQSLMFLLGSDSKFFMRYAMIAALMGGMGGLPGYEDIKNLVVAMLRFMGFNADAEVQVRQMVRDYMGDAIPADMVLHGLARRGFGIPAGLDALGSIYTGRPGRGFDMTKPGQNVPAPMLDRSKAVTPGPVIPEQVWQMMDPTKTAQESLGGASSQALGYGFSAAVNMMRAIMDPHLSAGDPKRWEKAEPRALASLSKMYRALTEGRERTGGPAGGTTITNYDIRDPEQMMEVLALGLGYNDLRRSNEWNRIMAQNEHGKYIDMQRKGLMENFHEARRGDNKDEIDRVVEKIKDFNAGLSDTDKGKAIKAENLRESYVSREKERVRREINVPTKRGNVPISQEFETLFPRTIELRPR